VRHECLSDHPANCEGQHGNTGLQPILALACRRGRAAKVARRSTRTRNGSDFEALADLVDVVVV
jgi:hypothetical protein